MAGDDAEFAAVSFALYAPDKRGFTNKLNERVTFDGLMWSLSETPVGKGACYGTHVCYAVARLLAVNEQVPILSQSGVRCGKDYLVRIASLLLATQHPDRAWRADWSEGGRWGRPAPTSLSWGGDVHVTGHHLEWVAIAPHRVLPADSIHRAIDFLARSVRAATPEEIVGSYCPWSHAARSLLLWRAITGRMPFVL